MCFCFAKDLTKFGDGLVQPFILFYDTYVYSLVPNMAGGNSCGGLLHKIQRMVCILPVLIIFRQFT